MTIEAILDQVTRVAGVRAAVFCSYDGISIASQTAVGVAEDEQVAAMVAEIGRATRRLLRNLDDDEHQMAMFGASTGNLVMADAAKGFLVAITDQAANTGLLRMEVERAAQELSTRLLPPSAGAPEETQPSEQADEHNSADAENDAPM